MVMQFLDSVNATALPASMFKICCNGWTQACILDGFAFLMFVFLRLETLRH